MASSVITTGRRRVEITRPDKPLFPCGITKLDLAHHYEQVASVMLPHVRDRPLNLERYPDGIDGERIVQQRAGRYFPAWIKRARVGTKNGSVEHVVANDAATLVYLAGQACLTPHPWLSRADRLQRPDRMTIDLDPSHDNAAEVRRAARIVVDALGEIELQAWVMTTGSRGYHVTVPLARRTDFVGVRDLARGVARLLAAREPKLFTTEQRKAQRGGRILIDVMRNAYGHTSVAPYAVRARPGAPVAAPLHLEELADCATRPDLFTVRSLPARLEREGDPWREMDRHRQPIATAQRRLAGALTEIDGR